MTLILKFTLDKHHKQTSLFFFFSGFPPNFLWNNWKHKPFLSKVKTLLMIFLRLIRCPSMVTQNLFTFMKSRKFGSTEFEKSDCYRAFWPFDRPVPPSRCRFFQINLFYLSANSGEQPKLCIIVLSVWRILSNKDLPAGSCFISKMKEGRSRVWGRETYFNY